MTNKKVMNPVEAGMIGAVAGAAVGAAAVILSEEKNREAIGDEIDEVKKGGQKIYNQVKGKVEDMATDAKDKAEKAVAQGEKKVDEVKKVIKK
jgi:gas vesicle protein